MGEVCDVHCSQPPGGDQIVWLHVCVRRAWNLIYKIQQKCPPKFDLTIIFKIGYVSTSVRLFFGYKNRYIVNDH